ncbi:MAG: methylated-DNA--[protein]-cysteine S-methyltransferase [Dehalococcoidia bacterium]|nr:methylated-DNA--[protein]-cysteine S-methyltransferase [Dehalococcoidia bacterium]
MNEALRYAVVRLAPGWVGLLSSSKGLRRLVLPQSSAEQARSCLRSYLDGATADVPYFEALLSRLAAYFEGRAVSFEEKLDHFEATPFQVQVWEAVRGIPYGETRSYAWVAERIGPPGAARAAGQALAANPAPIIVPCHRVIRSGGGLGGFSGGQSMKEYLLKLEGGSPGGLPLR